MNTITKETFDHIKRIYGKNFHYDDIPSYLRRGNERAFEEEILRQETEDKIRLEIASDREDDEREVNGY